jgi:hypothetical protein
LLEITIKMLKQKANDEKDALKNELDAYKKIIDARKELLDQQKKEYDYQNKLAEKNKSLSNIENELLDIQFDNSEWANKRRLELEEEKADKTKEINELQLDKSIEDQKDALDKEYEDYKEYIDAKINELDRYLSESGNLSQEAIDLLSNRTDAFYEELLNWNRVYGTGVDTDVTGKWMTAFNSIITYSGGAGAAIASNLTNPMKDFSNTVDEAIKKSEALEKAYKSTDWMRKRSATGDPYGGGAPFFHSGGVVGGRSVVPETEVLARLLPGETVLSINDTRNLISNIIPAAAGLGSTGNVGVSLSFNVQGNLDKTVVPEIEKIAISAINKAMKKRGIKNSVSSFSI